MFKKAPLRVLFSFVIVITFFPLEAAQKNTGMAGGEEFLGIWEYQETYTYEPMNYLKILKAGPGKFRLIEGVKGWYVNDKSRIKWYDQKEQYFDPPVIYLRPSDGKLIGEFDSGVFRATHGKTFTYRLTLEPKSRDKILYSVWSSIFGKKETFEATRVGALAESKESATSKGQAEKQNGVAGGTSPRLGIPKQFHGSWDEPSDRCKLGSESDSRIRVTSNEISYYEAFCSLKKGITSETYRFSGRFDCEGEGNKWTEQISLKLDNGKLIHKHEDGRISHNTRCK